MERFFNDELCSLAAQRPAWVENIIIAQKEAIKRGIEANAIIINDFLYYSRFSVDFRNIEMICGLKVVPGEGELPDNVAFGIIHADKLPPTLMKKLSLLEEENRELKEKLQRIREVTEYEDKQNCEDL